MFSFISYYSGNETEGGAGVGCIKLRGSEMAWLTTQAGWARAAATQPSLDLGPQSAQRPADGGERAGVGEIIGRPEKNGRRAAHFPGSQQACRVQQCLSGALE